MAGAFDTSIPIDSDVSPTSLPNGEYDAGCFRFKKWDAIGIQVNIKSDFIKEGMSFCAKNHISSIALNSFQGYTLQNTDFLVEYPFVKKISINGSYMSKAGIYALPELEELSLDDWNSDIDLRKFPKLKSFGGFYNNELIFGPEHDTLETLRLWDFSGNDLHGLPLMSKLKHLLLVQAKINSLNGLDQYPQLNSIALDYCKKLIDISDLRHSAIKWLEIDTCNQINDITLVLKAVSTLQGIKLRGKITLPSVNFVHSLPKLRYFYFWNCDVIDGDMSPCIGVEFVYFKDKKHFHPKCKAFEKSSKSFEEIEAEIIYGKK